MFTCGIIKEHKCSLSRVVVPKLGMVDKCVCLQRTAAWKC